MSKWREIWNNKGDLNSQIDWNNISWEDGFWILKEQMGITNLNKEGEQDNNQSQGVGFIEQFQIMLREMTFSRNPDYVPKSIYDVGCGSGNCIWLSRHFYADENVVLGGLDYSESLIKVAKEAMPDVTDLRVCEASQINADEKYDIVYSRSIFQYFESIEYAKDVAEKMIQKSNHCAAFFDIHDETKKEAFLSKRREMIEDYDVKYADTRHLFLPKQLFIELAEAHGCSIKFSPCILANYWNSEFTYDVYIWK